VDGSTQQLKILDNPLSLWHNDLQIAAIRYRLSGKATSIGYDYCEINLESYSVQFTLSGPDTYQFTSGDFVSVDINADDTWSVLTNTRITADTIAPPSENLPDGDYILTIQPSGSVTYRGFKTGRIDFGDLKTASLPSSITFGIIKDVDEDIYLGLSQDIGVEESEWSWSFVAGHQTQISIPQGALSCIGSSYPENVFASISDKVEAVFQEQGSGLKSWAPGIPGDTLINILPDVTLYVSVYEDCTLVISG